MGTTKRKIGAAVFGFDHPFYNDMKTGLFDQSAEEGLSLAYRPVDFNVRNQLAAIDALVKEDKAELLILTGSEDKRIIEKVNELEADGIPVITLTTDLPSSKRRAYIGTDAYKTGKIAAGLMGMLSGGKSEICVVTGSDEIYCHKERVRGFREYSKTAERNLTIDAIISCQDDDYKCYEDLQKVIAQFPMIRGVAFLAGGIYGGCKALFQLTTSMHFNVVTFAEIPTTLDFMQKGVIDMTIVEDARRQGRNAVRVAERILTGQDYNEMNYALSAIKTKECL